VVIAGDLSEVVHDGLHAGEQRCGERLFDVALSVCCGCGSERSSIRPRFDCSSTTNDRDEVGDEFGLVVIDRPRLRDDAKELRCIVHGEQNVRSVCSVNVPIVNVPSWSGMVSHSHSWDSIRPARPSSAYY
jgi:hypothetical protein